jgi:hypothetical protein
VRSIASNGIMPAAVLGFDLVSGRTASSVLCGRRSSVSEYRQLGTSAGDVVDQTMMRAK